MKRCAFVAVMLLAPLGGTGCSDPATGNGTDMATPAGPAWRGSLDVEIRDSIEVALAPAVADGAILDVELTLKTGGLGVLAPGQPLRGNGRVERLPEARTDLYVAKLAGAAVPSGPCGAKPVSLALSLARREGNDRVAGGLTAYCGENVWSGVPARVLRLSGKLPFVSAK